MPASGLAAGSGLSTVPGSAAVGTPTPVAAPGSEMASDPGALSAPGVDTTQVATPSAGSEAARTALPGPGAFDPQRRGVRALAAVAALVVLGAGLWAWRSRPQVEPVAAPATSTTPSAVDGAVPTPATDPTELVVAVAGRVRRPGLVRLPAGARVADAIAAAGGAQPGVDVALLNPARKVSDGELILVGVTPPPEAAAPAGAAPAPGVPAVGGKINLNTATAAQLETLPGVGPVLAQRIIAHRDRQGGFRSVSDLRQVSGIGDSRYEQLKDLVTV